MKKVRATTHTYHGFEYQTLQSALIMLKWLQHPTRYTKILIEGSQKKEAPKGIDDVVCERPDKKRDYWQIKAASAENEKGRALSWDWLLKKEKKSSVLQKLGKAASEVNRESIGDIILLTNRVPDEKFENSLDNDKVSFEHIEIEIKNKILTQLDNETVNFLFQNLKVQHSQKETHQLRREIKSIVSKYSQAPSIFSDFIAIVRDWVIFTEPSDDDWHYLAQVRDALNPREYRAISQNFYLPDYYIIPDQSFHEKVLEEVTSSNNKVVTITGYPGMGKSTYLSFLFEHLQTDKIPVIRHHYFLSVDDRTIDRIPYRSVALSLLQQIKQLSPKEASNSNRPESLKEELTKLANQYAQEGKKLIVILDGLDHVWRENNNDIRPLDEVLSQLFPTSENITIVLGIQPLEANTLPRILNRYSPIEEWHTLPTMSEPSISEYLQRNTRIPEHQKKDLKQSVNIISSFLHQATKGYPLYLIYVLEYLVATQPSPSKWPEADLPENIQNIRDYYQYLWKNLSIAARKVLYLCSSFDFIWPRSGLNFITQADKTQNPQLETVMHLLYEDTVGIRIFHESLASFVKQQPLNFNPEQILQQVITWLKDSSLTHLKHTWLWLLEAQSGDSVNLRRGVNKDWILDRLSEGYTPKVLVRIISAAEQYALEEQDYSEAYTHRKLKSDVYFKIENIQELEELKILSLLNASEDLSNTLLSSLEEMTLQEKFCLSISLWLKGKKEKAVHIAEIARKQYQNYQLSSQFESDESRSLDLLFIRTHIIMRAKNSDDSFLKNDFEKWPPVYLQTLITSFTDTPEDAINFFYKIIEKLPSNSPLAVKIELVCHRLAISEELDLSLRDKSFVPLTPQKLFHLYYCKKYKKLPELEDSLPKTVFLFKDKIHHNETIPFHQYFFQFLIAQLDSPDGFKYPKKTIFFSSVDISDLFSFLDEIIQHAKIKLAEKGYLSFEYMISLFSLHHITKDGQRPMKKIALGQLERSWISIAADCHLATVGKKVTLESLQQIISKSVFSDELIFNWYQSYEIKIFSNKAENYLIESIQISKFSKNNIQETAEYSNDYISFSHAYLRSNNTIKAKESLRKTWEYLFNYGTYKDFSIVEVTKAINYLSNYNPPKALEFLEQISPFISHLYTFTNGDDQDNILYYKILSKLSPTTTSSVYRQQLVDGKWSEAEDLLIAFLNEQEHDYSNSVTQSLLLTLLETTCHTALQKKIQQNIPEAVAIGTEFESRGMKLYPLSSEKNKAEPEFLEVKFPYEQFPPQEIKGLLSAMEQEDFRFQKRQLLRSWYQFWVDNDKEKELINNLEPQVELLSGLWSEENVLLKLLFESKIIHKGKSQSLYIIQHYFNSNNMWSEYVSESESIKLLQTIVEKYSKNIDSFIQDTWSFLNQDKRLFLQRVTPGSKLVYTLLLSQKEKEAENLVTAMVQYLQDSFRGLHLPKPKWNWSQDESDLSASEQILVSRLLIPNSSVKWLVTSEIAFLLKSKNKTVEDLLLKELESKKLESEAIEILSIFLLAKEQGYFPPENLSQYIKARSILSDLIIQTILPETKNLGNYQNNPTSLFLYDCQRDMDQDIETLKEHLSPIYLELLKHIEKNTGQPLYHQFCYEWNCISQRKEVKNINTAFFLWHQGNTSYFTNYQITDIYHVGLSSYLRVLFLLNQYFPDHSIEDLAALAMPYNPLLTRRLNLNRPSYISRWESQKIDINTIKLYISENLNSIAKNKEDDVAHFYHAFTFNNFWLIIQVSKVLVSEQLSPNLYDHLKRTNGSERPDAKKVKNDPRVLFITQTSPKKPFEIQYPWHPIWGIAEENSVLNTPYIEGLKILSEDNGLISLNLEGKKIGRIKKWQESIQMAYPRKLLLSQSSHGVGSSITFLNKNEYQSWLPTMYKEAFPIYHCSVALLKQENKYQDYQEETFKFTLPCH